MKTKWMIEKTMEHRSLGTVRVYAKNTRSEIIVRIERDGDKLQYAEWGMPKALGIALAIEQAVLQTEAADIRP